MSSNARFKTIYYECSRGNGEIVRANNVDIVFEISLRENTQSSLRNELR